MHARASQIFVAVALCTSACTSDIANCGDEPDVTGSWQLTLTASQADLGTGATLTSDVTVDAQLEQAGKTDLFGISHYLYGTLTSDPSVFGTLSIPRLLHNDGSKTGAILGCELRINIPIAMPVSDDNIDQGPLRIGLAGKITAKGVMTGIEGSHLILQSDATSTQRDFAWTGARR